MASAPFHFKKFSVEQAQGVHPVGTDGVLLGAWADTGSAKNILDVGAGAGIVALMMAQRSAADVDITAIEPDESSFQCALKNFATSPWVFRLRAVNSSLQDFQPDGLFDLIVSNPPFFSEKTISPDPNRSRARHILDLSLELILEHCLRLLSPGGRVCLILPEKEGRQCCELAVLAGLYCNHEMQVRSREGKPVERFLLSFSRDPAKFQRETLCIHNFQGEYSDEFRALTAGFYLKF